LTSARASLETFVTASVLLDGLDKDNKEIGPGERVNGTVQEKLSNARGWFEILCGIGEDGEWSQEQLRMYIRQDLSVIEGQVDTASKNSPRPHFRRWLWTSTVVS
jgi:hypothetical protein